MSGDMQALNDIRVLQRTTDAGDDDDAAESRSRSRRRHPSADRKERSQQSRHVRAAPTRPPVAQVSDSAVQQEQRNADCTNVAPYRSVRGRRPTPFNFAPAPPGVRFGLTTLVDEGAPEDEALVEREASAITQANLRERSLTPPPSDAQRRSLVVTEDEPSCFKLSRQAFDASFPSHACSAADECAVCHDSFDGEDAKIFPCNHVFHADCIWQWFQHNPSCPLCRRSFLSELGGQHADPIPSHPLLDAGERVPRGRVMSV